MKFLNYLKNNKALMAMVAGFLTSLLGIGGTVANANAGPEALSRNSNVLVGTTAIGTVIAGVGAALRRPGARSTTQIEAADLKAICHLRARARAVVDPADRAAMLTACDGLTGAIFRLNEQEAASATK